MKMQRFIKVRFINALKNGQIEEYMFFLLNLIWTEVQ